MPGCTGLLSQVSQYPTRTLPVGGSCTGQDELPPSGVAEGVGVGPSGVTVGGTVVVVTVGGTVVEVGGTAVTVGFVSPQEPDNDHASCQCCPGPGSYAQAAFEEHHPGMLQVYLLPTFCTSCPAVKLVPAL